MLNIDEFIKRLELILDFYNVNASSFADKIGVQRSSLSHLLSGRNKPSLDFILKIIEVFPDVDLYWLLNGIGSFPKNNKVENLDISAEIKPITSPTLVSVNDENNLFSEINDKIDDLKIVNKTEPVLTKNDIVAEKNEIEKIVIFFKNGTFKYYKPEN